MTYEEYCKWFDKAWKYLVTKSVSFDTLVEEVCDYRKYKDVARWKLLMKDVGLAKVSFTYTESKVLSEAFPSELGLFKDKSFLLNNTYMIPVRDMEGHILAIVGWIPGKKYITTPSLYFDKSCLFFGMEQFKGYDMHKQKTFFIVEGIFDSLSLRSLGFKCLGNMGITGSPVKAAIMKLPKKVIAIPDGDRAGRNVVETDQWLLPVNGSYVTIPAYAEEMNIKDVDDIIKLCPVEAVIEEFSTYVKDTHRKIMMDL